MHVLVCAFRCLLCPDCHGTCSQGGRVGLVSSGGSLATESVEDEVNRDPEWRSADGNEAKKHVAVLVLHEMAVNSPTFLL